MSYSSEDMSDMVSEFVKKRKEAIVPNPPNTMSEGKQKLQKWLNKYFKVVLADGRILIGLFLCTDGNSNIILGMCSEFTEKMDDERVLGLVMVPGRHIISIFVN